MISISNSSFETDATTNDIIGRYNIFLPCSIVDWIWDSPAKNIPKEPIFKSVQDKSNSVESNFAPYTKANISFEKSKKVTQNNETKNVVIVIILLDLSANSTGFNFTRSGNNKTSIARNAEFGKLISDDTAPRLRPNNFVAEIWEYPIYSSNLTISVESINWVNGKIIEVILARIANIQNFFVSKLDVCSVYFFSWLFITAIV